MKKLEYGLDLFHRVGRARLLPVPEGGVGDEHLLGRVDRQHHVVEVDAGDFLVGVDVPHQVGFINVLDVFAHRPGTLMVQDSFLGFQRAISIPFAFFTFFRSARP